MLRGETIGLEFTFPTGVDLNDATEIKAVAISNASAQLVYTKGNGDAALTITVNGTYPNKCSLVINSEQSESLPLEDLYFEIKAILADEQVIKSKIKIDTIEQSLT